MQIDREMKTARKLRLILGGVALLLALPSAEAAEHQPKLTTKYGMSAMIGGGVVGFTDPDVADMTHTGASWTARLTLGTRTLFAVEAAYVGSAQGIDALNLDGEAFLLANGFEADVRLNFLTGMWQPYAFVGAAWKSYRITNADFNTSSVADTDDVGEIPVGAGLSLRYEGLVADLRLSFNPAVGNDLIPTVVGGQLELNNWNASLRMGWEF